MAKETSKRSAFLPSESGCGCCVPCPPEVTVGVGPGAWEGGHGAGVNTLLFLTPPEEKSTADGVGGQAPCGESRPI